MKSKSVRRAGRLRGSSCALFSRVWVRAVRVWEHGLGLVRRLGDFKDTSVRGQTHDLLSSQTYCSLVLSFRPSHKADWRGRSECVRGGKEEGMFPPGVGLKTLSSEYVEAKSSYDHKRSFILGVTVEHEEPC